MQREGGPRAHLRNRFGALTRDALLLGRVRGPSAHGRDLGSVDSVISAPNLLRHIGTSPIVAVKHAGWPRPQGNCSVPSSILDADTAGAAVQKPNKCNAKLGLVPTFATGLVR